MCLRGCHHLKVKFIVSEKLEHYITEEGIYIYHTQYIKGPRGQGMATLMKGFWCQRFEIGCQNLELQGWAVGCNVDPFQQSSSETQ